MTFGKAVRFGFVATVAFALGACGSGYDRPQKEHTFTSDLTDAQRAQADYNKRVRDRISDEEKAVQYKRLLVTIAKLETDSPFAGLGFLPHKSVAYAVQRDSNAALFSHSGKLDKLDKLLTHIDRAEIAGDHGTRILGLSSHGSQAAWNTGNLSQQLVLRPQNSTFGRIKMFDSQPVSKGSYLITASEGGLLERWSLASGNKVASVKFTDYQPRQIARNISVNRVIFGTNDGQVRIWHGGRGSAFQYRHTGPLLEIICIPKHNLIASVGKDGQVILFDMSKRKIIMSQQFPKADYQLVLSDDQRRLVASPAVGRPIAIDIQTSTSIKIRNTPTNLTTKVAFTAASEFALSQHGANGVMLWNMSRPSPLTYPLTPEAPGIALDFAIAEHSNLAVILTDKNYLEYWDVAKRAYLGPAIRSIGTSIARFALSDDGKWLVVGLTDGRIMRQRVAFDEKTAVVVE